VVVIGRVQLGPGDTAVRTGLDVHSVLLGLSLGFRGERAPYERCRERRPEDQETTWS
jgi:hypothetical protein